LKRVVGAVEDLMFRGRISAAAEAGGVEASFPRTKDKVLAAVAQAPPDLIVLDLTSERHDPLSLLESLKSDEKTSAIPVVGFLPHVRGDLALAARERGCDKVMARSAFVENLPSLVGGENGSFG
jgi:CheY-like chemotaxis protein